MKSKKPFKIIYDIEHKNYEPCAALWLAVAERAIVDYCNFFDYWTTIANRYVDFNRKPTNYFAATKRLELESLEKFLFDPQVKTYNLAWIFEECSREDDTLLEAVRAEIIKKHEANLYKHRKHPVLASIVAMYETDKELNATDCEPMTKIRRRAKIH